jgi:arylsulfatase
MIVSWPRGIKHGTALRTSPCHFVDILPTFVDLAGSSASGIQPSGPSKPGVSLAKAITSGQQIKRDFIYFNHSDNRALRKGDWKIVARGLAGSWELYDMRTDRCEQNNLAAKMPALVLSMSDQWHTLDQLYAKQRESAPSTPAKRMPELKTA